LFFLMQQYVTERSTFEQLRIAIGLLAATFLTLDNLAPNRGDLAAFGAWWDPLARICGIDRRRPLTARRETVEVMRRLLAMERVTFHGEFHHVDGIEARRGAWRPEEAPRQGLDHDRSATRPADDGGS
jgi:hypothetical protein